MSAPLADALVLTSEAYVSLKTVEAFGLLARERSLYARLWPSFSRVIVVSYGDKDDLAITPTLCPGQTVESICNERGLEPGCFISTVPDAVLRRLSATGCRSALVITDQFWGGDVAVCITRALRAGGIRTGLCARGGYHWSWTMAREHGTGSRPFAQARHLESELVHAADIIITTTPKIIDDLAFQHGAPPERFRLVPNYLVASGPLPPFSSRTPGLIVTAGRLAREKRIDLLLRAAATLPPAQRDAATVCIVGCGPEEQSLRALAATLPIRVEFRGRLAHADLLALMGRAAVYAQLSEYEGHPKTVLEALSMAAPTLVSDGPGIADHIAHGTTGLICRPETEAVAGALTMLLTDPRSAEAMGTAGATRIRAELGIDTLFPFYRQACADAMVSAGAGRPLPPSVVRWDQPMLTLPPDAAAANWAASMDAFTKRLEPAAREVFLTGVRARLGPAPAARNARSPQSTLRALSKP